MENDYLDFYPLSCVSDLINVSTKGFGVKNLKTEALIYYYTKNISKWTCRLLLFILKAVRLSHILAYKVYGSQDKSEKPILYLPYM